MTARDKLSERLSLFDDTIKGKSTSRVPTLSNDFTWRLLDTVFNIKPSEALRSFDKFRQITFEFQERYNYDCYEMPGMRNNFPMADAVGGTHTINDETGAIQSLDRQYLHADELAAFAADPINVLWQSAAPRAFENVTYEQLVKAIKASMEQSESDTQITAILADKYGVPASSRTGGFLPVEELFNQYRGIMGLSCDMRRNAEQVKAVCEAGKEGYLSMYDACFRQGHRGAAPISVWDVNTTMLATSIMNPKQFEIFYWPAYKAMLDIAVNTGCTVFQFTEASMAKFADFFRDIQAGTLSVLVEKDDLGEMKKILPNITFIGGMDVNYLGHSTPEECVREAKGLIDTLYPNYIFSTNKMMSFKGDAKRENLLAVQDFVLNYNPNEN